jgi:hypothetical protein
MAAADTSFLDLALLGFDDLDAPPPPARRPAPTAQDCAVMSTEELSRFLMSILAEAQASPVAARATREDTRSFDWPLLAPPLPEPPGRLPSGPVPIRSPPRTVAKTEPREHPHGGSAASPFARNQVREIKSEPVHELKHEFKSEPVHELTHEIKSELPQPPPVPPTPSPPPVGAVPFGAPMGPPPPRPKQTIRVLDDDAIAFDEIPERARGPVPWPPPSRHVQAALASPTGMKISLSTPAQRFPSAPALRAEPMQRMTATRVYKVPPPRPRAEAEKELDATTLDLTIDELNRIDGEDRAALLRSARFHAGLERAMRFHYGTRPVPLRDNVRFYQYQERAQNWMAVRETAPPVQDIQGWLLNLDMGLGKTPITAIYIFWRPKGAFPSLVIASLSVLNEWHRTARKFFTAEAIEARMLFLHPTHFAGGASELAKLRREDLAAVDIVVTTYEMVLQSYKKLAKRVKDSCIVYKEGDGGKIDYVTTRPRETADLPGACGTALLHGTPWERVICDESQRISNPAKATYRAVMSLYGRYRGHLTGTITRNYVTDIWAQLRALGYTGVLRKRDWSKTSAPTYYARHGLREVIYRLTYKEAGIELPTCHLHRVEVDLTPRERQVCLLVEKKAREVFESAVAKQTSYANVLVMLMRSRQAAVAPVLLNSRGALEDMDGNPHGGSSGEVDDDSRDPEEAFDLDSYRERAHRKLHGKKRKARKPPRQRVKRETKRARTEKDNGGMLAISGAASKAAAEANAYSLAEMQRREEERQRAANDSASDYGSRSDESGSESDSGASGSSSDSESVSGSDSDSGSASRSRSRSPGRKHPHGGLAEDAMDLDAEEGSGSGDGEEKPVDAVPVDALGQMLFEDTGEITAFCTTPEGEGGVMATKMRTALGIMRDFFLTHRGEKLLAFSMFTSVLELYELAWDTAVARSRAAREGLDEDAVAPPELAAEWWYLPPELWPVEVMQLTGTTVGKARMSLLEEFGENANARILLISGKAGGEGLNIVEASGGILFEPHWTPAMHKQQRARFHRIGQTRETHWWELVAKDTIEQRIHDIWNAKDEIAAMFSTDTRARKNKHDDGEDKTMLTMDNIGRLLGGATEAAKK